MGGTAMRRASLLLAVLLLAGATPVLAQGATVSDPIELAKRADLLKPGEWVWAPTISPAGPITIVVDLSRQIADVYRNGVRIGVTTVSTGRPGYETPTGVFTILQKDATHHSKKYDNAPMPYQERLTWDGVALHAGGLPGYPESHGCVHLPLEFSKLLFGVTDLGMTVVVTGKAGVPTLASADGVLAPVVPGGGADPHVPLAPGEAFRWTPAAAPAGPVTIVVSESDNRVVVLRNGVEIGRARVTIDPPPFGTHVLQLVQDGGSARWLVVSAPGESDVGKVVDGSAIQRLHMPADFYAQVRPLIVPGVTVLLTEAPVVDLGRPVAIVSNAGPSGSGK